MDIETDMNVHVFIMCITILNIYIHTNYSLKIERLISNYLLFYLCTEFYEDDFQSYLKGLDVDTPVSSAIRQTISTCLVYWKPLGRQLGLSDATIEMIQHNNTNDYDEQKYQCLYHWVKHRGRDATILNLLRVIYYRLNDKGSLDDIVQSLNTAKSGQLLFVRKGWGDAVNIQQIVYIIEELVFLLL